MRMHRQNMGRLSPSHRSGKSISEQIRGGFLLAGEILLAFAWLCALGGGVLVAFTHTQYPPPLGWLLLVIDAAVFLAIIDRCARAFAGILAYGILNGLLMLFSGHVIDEPNVPFPRLEAAGLIVFALVSAILALKMAKRGVSIPDRIALLALVAFYTWAVADQRWVVVAVACTAGILSLVAATVYDHSHPRPRPTKHRERHVGTA